MSLDAQLWKKAEELASQIYDIETFRDTLTNGDIVILAKNPELPGCMAHGATLDEAIENLKEARTEYIYSLLLDGLPVPHPRGSATSTAVRQSSVEVEYRVVVGFGSKLEKATRDKREEDVAIIYRGDFS